MFYSYVNSTRSKKENAYGRWKSDFNVFEHPYRGHDLELYDRLAHVTAEITEVGLYYSPLRTSIPEHFEPFL